MEDKGQSMYLNLRVRNGDQLIRSIFPPFEGWISWELWSGQRLCAVIRGGDSSHVSGCMLASFISLRTC